MFVTIIVPPSSAFSSTRFSSKLFMEHFTLKMNKLLSFETCRRKVTSYRTWILKTYLIRKTMPHFLGNLQEIILWLIVGTHISFAQRAQNSLQTVKVRLYETWVRLLSLLNNRQILRHLIGMFLLTHMSHKINILADIYGDSFNWSAQWHVLTLHNDQYFTSCNWRGK
jgi:hypothetical protein